MMSRALPWGTPSMMSIRATSAISFSTMRCAAVAPTLPAPTTVTLCFIRGGILTRGERSAATATMIPMPERPDYKSHPLWAEAMALAHEAYGVAEKLRPRDPEAAKLLRRAAVAVPARVAG